MSDTPIKSAADAPKTGKPHVAPPAQPQTNPAPAKPAEAPPSNSNNVKK